MSCALPVAFIHGISFVLPNRTWQYFFYNMESISVHNRKFVVYYRNLIGRSRYLRRHMIARELDILKCLSLILFVIAKNYVENEGGVFLKRIGYLCHIINPKTKFREYKRTGEICYKRSDGFKYHHICLDNFMTDARMFHLKIQASFKRKIYKMFEEGYRYKFLYRMVLSEDRRTRRAIVRGIKE